MSDDWDLHAVVRGCTAAAATTASATPACSVTSSYTPDSYGFPAVAGWNRFSVPDSFDPRSSCVEEPSHDPYNSFFFKGLDSFSLQMSSPVSPLYPAVHNRQRQEQGQNKRALGVAVSVPAPNGKTGSSHTSRSKRRKIQHKTVCHVPAEALNSDVWAWRKYGQKPIKGSPYPRGYYRCSTSKGCSARKQVERNRSDPKIFIITYTSEHNHPAPTHRNSLAGVSRQKHSDGQPAAAAASDSTKPSAATAEEARKTEDLTVEDYEIEDDNDLLSLSDTVLSDDIFEQLDMFAGDSSSVDFPASCGAPWLAGHSTAPTRSF